MRLWRARAARHNRLMRNSLSWFVALALAMLLHGQALAEVPAPGDDELPEDWRASWLDEPVFDGRLRLVEAGEPEAPPVLLVHGLGENGWRDWREVMHELAGDYRVLAIDLPGFGESSTVAREVPLSPASYSRLLSWLRAELALDELHLVGHSMGAAVALYHAAEQPGGLATLTLVDVAGVLQRTAFVRESVMAEYNDVWLPGRLGDHARRLINWGGSVVERLGMLPDFTEALRRSDAAWAAVLGDRANINAALSLVDTDFSRMISDLEISASIIWGDRDTIAPLRTGHLLEGRLETARLRVIEGAAHVPMQTHTDAFMAALNEALQSPPQAGHEWRRPQGEVTRDYVCRNESGGRISGDFRHVVIENCTDVHLFDVSARSVDIERAIVDLTHVRVVAGEGPALAARGATVNATNVWLEGEPAVRVSDSRLDIAGGSLRAREAALRVDERSIVIFSVSDMRSARYSGNLHSAVRAENAVLDESFAR